MKEALEVIFLARVGGSMLIIYSNDWLVSMWKEK